MGTSADPPFIEYGGRVVAVAGRTRCYFAVDDLDAATENFVAVMCLCRREVDEGRIDGPFNSELAARWARLVMIGPSNVATKSARTTTSRGAFVCRSSKSAWPGESSVTCCSRTVGSSDHPMEAGSEALRFARYCG